MADTPKLTLPLIDGAQSQKHVTHNEALALLDVLIQLNVKDRNLTAPPGSPSSGDSYIVAATATGDWAGQENSIAYWDGAAWAFVVPKEGWRAYVKDEDVIVQFDGAAWGSAAVQAHTHAAGDVTSGTFANARVAETNVTQHQGALAILEAQITDLQAYLLNITGESVGNLSDVDLTGLADGNTLQYVNANARFEPAASGGGATEFIATADLANDAAADFTGFDAAKYDAYLFVLQNVIPATDQVAMWMRTSTDGGLSFSTTTNYAYAGVRYWTFNGSQGVFAADGQAQIVLLDAVGSAAGEDGVSGQIWMPGPHLAKRTSVQTLLAFMKHDRPSVANGGGWRNVAEAVDAVRFMFSSGNLESGTITMYGLKNA